MIGRLARLLIAAFAYVCVGTVIAQAAGITYLVVRGAVTRDRFYRTIAAAYGIDPDEAGKRPTGESAPPSSEQPSLEAATTQRALTSLDLDLREQALKNGLDNLARMQSMLTVERERYDNLKTAFDHRLTQMQETSEQTALIEVQQTLENIQPKQAKEQLLLMLEDAGEDSMRSVVAIMKAMPMDRRKKIIGEFKTEDEVKKLADILQEIRLGDQELISETKKKLAQFKPQEN